MRASPDARITDVALEAGFPGLAEFSRAYRNHFGFNASAWDRKIPLPNSKNCKAPEPFPPYSEQELQAWRETERIEVRLATFPASRFVYIRVHNPYGSQRLVDAYYTLRQWLSAEQVDVHDVVMIGMSQDDPAITPKEKCRYDLGIAFPIEPTLSQLRPDCWTRLSDSADVRGGKLLRSIRKLRNSARAGSCRSGSRFALHEGPRPRGSGLAVPLSLLAAVEPL